METLTVILGLAVIYSTIHFMSIQHKAYTSRTQWEKVVTWAGMISIGMIYIGVMYQ